MKKIFLFTALLFSLSLFSQRLYRFKANNGEEKSIYLLYKDEIKKDFKSIKIIRTQYSTENPELNSFENQLNYLANLCLEKGGNAMWVKWIESIDEGFVMSAFIYNINNLDIKNDQSTKTELIVYKPKYFTGLGEAFSKLEIFINNEFLDLKKNNVFRKEIKQNEEVYLEIPKYKIREKIIIKEGERNYLRFVLQQEMPKGNVFAPNQIIIPLGKVFPVFNLVSEIQAGIETEKKIRILIKNDK